VSANFNRKEQPRHRVISLRQHGFPVANVLQMFYFTNLHVTAYLQHVFNMLKHLQKMFYNIFTSILNDETLQCKLQVHQ